MPEDPLRDGLKAFCSETPTAQQIYNKKMGLFESARHPAKTDPVERDLTLSLPPPSRPEKNLLIANALPQGQIP